MKRFNLFGDDREIVRDQDDGGTDTALEVAHQVEVGEVLLGDRRDRDVLQPDGVELGLKRPRVDLEQDGTLPYLVAFFEMDGHDLSVDPGFQRGELREHLSDERELWRRFTATHDPAIREFEITPDGIVSTLAGSAGEPGSNDGLGADARNPDAIRRIFAAKGRPAEHPLIVHLAGAAR